MAELDLTQFAGDAGPSRGAPPSSSTPPAGRRSPASSSGMSLQEFATGEKPLANEEFLDSHAKMAFDSVVESAKRVGGEFGAVADMVMGVLGMPATFGAQVGGTIQAAARGVPLSASRGAPAEAEIPAAFAETEGGAVSGVSRRRPGRAAVPGTTELNPTTAYSVGRQAASLIPEQSVAPIYSIFKLFENGEAYEMSKTSQGMAKLMDGLEKAGEHLEQATGGRIARDAVPMFAESLMTAAFGLGSGKAKPPIERAAMERMRKEAGMLEARMKQKALDEADAVARARMTPSEAFTSRPTQQAINDLLGIRSPADQAKLTRERRKYYADMEKGKGAELTPEQMAAMEVRGGEAFGTLEESAGMAERRADVRGARSAELERLAALSREQRTLDTDALPQKPEKIGQAEILRILQKPGFERTADDLMVLREARKEGGAIRPEVLGLLSAAGIGTVAGSQLDEDQLRGATLGGATALGAILPFLFRGESVPRRFRQSGAVKEPGGMWHPEAVERLAAPLQQSLVGRGENVNPAIQDFLAGDKGNWASKAVKNYLNKYAGTSRDPLKDVEIPFGEGVKRWEELTDRALQSNPAKLFQDVEGQPEWVMRAKPDERIWEARTRMNQEGNALSGYLSHVGDYLRQNVDPTKLQQYDLVRAVKETAANDARVAKEMAKAAFSSTKDLPVYKEYPDGMRWVELKKPEKLTPEQAKGIRKATEDESANARHGGYKGDAYVAIGPDGKAINNNYTGEVALGHTPEEAYLAGQLGQEGNQMGHCVGGYCEGVAAGESRIFSLRDKKGQSHVTVEVEPAGPRKVDPMLLQVRLPNGQYGIDPAYKAASLDRPNDNILQIKGKQNRAPNKEYLPYVQDFVRNNPDGTPAKWGEVGDLKGTGLRSQNQLDRAERKVADILFPGETFFNETQLAEIYKPVEQAIKEGGPVDVSKRIEEILQRPRQAGFADQRLVMGLGAAGMGGLIGSIWSEDPVSGAVLGALAGGVLSLPGVMGGFKEAVKGVERVAGVASTSLKNISEPLWKRVAIDHEKNVMTRAQKLLNEAVPWLRESANLPKSQREALDAALFSSDPAAVAEIHKGDPKLVDAWRKVRNILNELGGEAREQGRFKEMLSDYFPRRVKDFKGLKEALDQPIKDRLTTLLADAEKDALRRRGTGLTDVERDTILNRELRGYYKQNVNRPGYSKARTIREVTKQLEPFYYSPQEALYITTLEVVKDLEVAKLFGKDLVQSSGPGGRKYTNVDQSIGNVVGRELAEGRIKEDQVRELEGLLRSRFGMGERSPHRTMQDIKNLTYAGLLGDIPSATVQLSDPAISIFTQDLRGVLTATARKLTGNKKIGVEDFGLADHIAEEIAWGAGQSGASRAKIAGSVAGGAVVGGAAGMALGDDMGAVVPGAAAGAFIGLAHSVGTANALHKVLRQGVFKPLDSFGKDVALGAALDRGGRLARTEKGQVELRRKYGEAYGDELPGLIKDLKSGTISEPVRSYLFAELARQQPISKWEVPQAYLDNPNGRIMWQLKTFMLKQADIVRRDAFQEIKKGNVGRGLKNLTEFGIVLGVSGATTAMMQDWILGRDPHFEATDVMENVLKTFGLGSYVRDKIAQGKPIQAAGAAVLPPWQIMERILTADPQAVQYIPVVGQLYYNWELGGKEKAELRSAKEARKEGRESALSPSTERFLEKQREKRQEKRERRREQEIR